MIAITEYDPAIILLLRFFINRVKVPPKATKKQTHLGIKGPQVSKLQTKEVVRKMVSEGIKKKPIS